MPCTSRDGLFIQSLIWSAGIAVAARASRTWRSPSSSDVFIGLASLSLGRPPQRAMSTVEYDHNRSIFPWKTPCATLENAGHPVGQVLCFHSDRCEPGGQGTRTEVSSALSRPIAIQGLTASADYVDRWSARRAGFRGGKLGLRDGVSENTEGPIWQVVCFHSGRCPVGGRGTRMSADEHR